MRKYCILLLLNLNQLLSQIFGNTLPKWGSETFFLNSSSLKYVISQDAENQSKRKRKSNAFGTTRRYITTYFSNGELLKSVF